MLNNEMLVFNNKKINIVSKVEVLIDEEKQKSLANAFS